MFDIFENSDCWFLESFKINGNQLTIGIAEGIISSAKEDVRIDKNTKIDECSPIVVNERAGSLKSDFLTYFHISSPMSPTLPLKVDKSKVKFYVFIRTHPILNMSQKTL